MAHFLDLFTPETWHAFVSNGADVTGFRPSQRSGASHIKAGDKFYCYMVDLRRWVGVLTSKTAVFEDHQPYFVADDDPFSVRFRVEPTVVLTPELGIPIKQIWDKLEMCRGVSPNDLGWAYKVGVARSLKLLSSDDAATIESALREQAVGKQIYPLTSAEKRRVEGRSMVALPGGTAIVEIPHDEEPEEAPAPEATRRSIRIQALLAQIGTELGFGIWVPANDKGGVLRTLGQSKARFIENLPLNADDKTVETVERIDVLWIRGRSIVRAFEVEDTTAVYSGILRMSDLIALQPQFRIKLHIVAPETRADMVRRQILRPTFAYMEGGPLAKICTYLSYGAVEELAAKTDLRFMRDEIVEEYEEIME